MRVLIYCDSLMFIHIPVDRGERKNIRSTEVCDHTCFLLFFLSWSRIVIIDCMKQLSRTKYER
jgi:hypothetical protein